VYGYWDGSAWRPDVSAALHLMHVNSTAKFFIRRRALARIGEFVSKDETVKCMAAGTYYSWGNTNVTVVFTDRRLLPLIGGRRTARVREYPRESISDAKSGVLGSITVIANGKTLYISYVNPHDADDMVDAIRGPSSNRQRTRRAKPPWPEDLGKIRRWRVTDE
jgi:Bacterial PH domain